jgi:hypothetical protein
MGAFYGRFQHFGFWLSEMVGNLFHIAGLLQGFRKNISAWLTLGLRKLSINWITSRGNIGT